MRGFLYLLGACLLAAGWVAASAYVQVRLLGFQEFDPWTGLYPIYVVGVITTAVDGRRRVRYERARPYVVNLEASWLLEECMQWRNITCAFTMLALFVGNEVLSFPLRLGVPLAVALAAAGLAVMVWIGLFYAFGFYFGWVNGRIFQTTDIRPRLRWFTA